MQDLNESLVSNNMRLLQTQNLNLLGKRRAEKFPNLNPFKELKKAWNYIQIEPIFGLPNALSTPLKGHTSPVTSVCFSPDGELLASGSLDSTIKIWDFKDKSLQSTQTNHTRQINIITFSPNSQYLASGSYDTKIKILNLKNNEIKDHNYHKKEIITLSFDRNSTKLASASGKTIIISNLYKQDYFKLKGHYYKINSLCFSPTNDYLASGSDDCTVKVWDISKKMLEFSFTEPKNTILVVIFSPKGNFLLSGCNLGQIKVWNLSKKAFEFSLEKYPSQIKCLTFSHNGSLLASSSYDNTIQIWDFKNKTIKFTLIGHSNEITSISFNPKSNILASGSKDHLIKIWDLDVQKDSISLYTHLEQVYCVCFSPDGNLLASSSKDRLIKIMNINENKEIIELKGHNHGILCITFSPDGNFIASGSGDSLVKIWDLKTNTEIYNIKYPSQIKCLSFNPNGNLLASGCMNGLLKVYDLQKNEDFLSKTLIDTIYGLSFSPDGRLLAIGCKYSIEVWNINDKIQQYKLEGHIKTVSCLSFSPNGKFLASGSYDKLVKIWNLARKNEEFTFKGHKNDVCCLGFCPDGKFVASGSEDGNIKIWNLVDGVEEISFKAHEQQVCSLSFKADGKSLASGSANNEVKLWRFDKGIEGFVFGNDGNVRSFSFDGKYFAIALGEEIVVRSFISKEECCRINNQEQIKALKFSDDNSILYAKSRLGINAYCIENGNIINSEITDFEQEKRQYFLDPLSCSTTDCQNYLKKAENYYYLSKNLFEKIKNLNTTFSNLNFSIAHFLSMLGLESIIKKFTNSKTLTITPDYFGHGPVYYSILSKRRKLADLFISYMNDLAENDTFGFRTCLSLSTLEYDLPELLRNSSSGIEKLIFNSLSTQNNVVYPSIKNKKLPYKKICDYALVGFEDASAKNEDIIPMIIKQTSFRLPFEIGSPLSIDLLIGILECNIKDIYRTEIIQDFITLKWEKVRFFIYIHVFLLFGNIASFYLSMAYNNTLAMFCALIVNFLLMIWESFQINAIGKKYFLSFINVMDLSAIFAIVLYIILQCFDIEHYYFTWFIMFLTLYRGFTTFRAFEKTRYYVRLLQMSLQRIKYFLLIFIYSTLSLGILNSASTNSSSFTYDAFWSTSFGVIVGKTDAFLEGDILQIIVYNLAVTINMIIILNIIISILSDVFDESQMDADIFNFNEMADVILEVEQILSILGKTDVLKYLHVFSSAYEKPEIQWKGKVMDIKEYVGETFYKEKLKPLFDEHKIQINASDEKSIERFRTMDEKIKTIEEKVSANMNNIELKISTFQNKINSIENQIGKINQDTTIIIEMISKLSHN
ncbi:hypothetical protein SteCoe_8080 [Stentor coeruleus]|uniref:Uncharacterized protein n=1 Tax=Stentor coeruleus TaxID=5963 RepID=A0A1R2CL70_9CILI|nr:hypothetical protein SteCoe_8080 [Stentor coeruleus]